MFQTSSDHIAGDLQPVKAGIGGGGATGEGGVAIGQSGRGNKPTNRIPCVRIVAHLAPVKKRN